MPSPQINDGYTRLANELLDNICRLRITGNQYSILMCVLRKTYGWQKKSDKISLTQFEKKTNLSRPSVHKAIKQLVAKQILVAKQLPLGNEYQIQKDYSRWVTSSRADTSSRLATTLVAKQLPVLVAKQLHTKEKKETIQKKINTKVFSETHGNTLVNFLMDSFKKIYGFYPTDKRARWDANTLIKRVNKTIKSLGKDSVEENTKIVFSKYMSWILKQDWGENVQSMGTLMRKYPIYESLILKEGK